MNKSRNIAFHCIDFIFILIEMLLTKEMNVEERLSYVKSLWHKREEQRALEKQMNKRKRQESGNSINSSMSTASSNQKYVSPPNKKRRSELTKLGTVEGNENQSNSTYQDQKEEDLNSSLDTSQPINRGKYY